MRPAGEEAGRLDGADEARCCPAASHLPAAATARYSLTSSATQVSSSPVFLLTVPLLLLAYAPSASSPCLLLPAHALTCPNMLPLAAAVARASPLCWQEPLSCAGRSLSAVLARALRNLQRSKQESFGPQCIPERAWLWRGCPLNYCQQHLVPQTAHTLCT